MVSELELARAPSELLTASPNGGTVLGATSRDAFGKILAAAQGQSPDHPEYPALSLQAASGLALTGLADNDPKLID